MANPTNKSYDGIITWATGSSNDIQAKNLITARNIKLTSSSGAQLATASFNGTADATLKLVGTVPISISGNAAYATSAGTCTGNAATATTATTATKLKTPRTISLTGDVTGSGSFDGSGNLAIATAIAASAMTSDIIAISLDGGSHATVDGAIAVNNFIYSGNDTNTKHQIFPYIILIPLSGLGGLWGSTFRFLDNGTNDNQFYSYLMLEGGTIVKFQCGIKYYYPIPFFDNIPTLITSISRSNPCGYVWDHKRNYTNEWFMIDADR